MVQGVLNLEINALGFNDEADDNFNQRWDLSVGLHFSNYDDSFRGIAP